VAAFRALLTHIYEYPDRKVLIHCSLGKDRTGLLFALLLSLAGVPDDIIAADYCASQSALELHKAKFEKLLRAFRPNMIEEEAALLVDRFITTRPDYIQFALSKIRHTYGGVYEYVRDKCLLQEDVVDSIKESLIQRNDD
jgi:protein tyrosine/serine phosphatase